MGTQSLSIRMRVLCKDIIVDSEDVENYGHLKCFVLKNHLHYKYYGIRMEGVRIYLHRFLMQAPADMVVDHINGITTDNRKENLRLCTNIENTKNLRKQSNGITSQYKGVSFYARDKTWEVNVAGHYIGRYLFEVEAARVYNIYATKLFGKFAKLNSVT